jgi:hypothetical protein
MQVASCRLIHATAATVSLWAWPVAAQDKPVHVVDTDPAPVAIEEGIFFQQTGLVTMAVRNRHTSPLIVTIRAWAFTDSGRLRGTTTLCVSEPLDRGTKRISSLSLEVRGLETSDGVAVAVVHALDDRQQWDVADVESDAATVARSRALGRGGRLRLTATPVRGPSATACSCELTAAAASCDAQCAETGLGAFTAAPTVFGGCSASCSCK